ncbi:MAG: cellulose binding domain-containing protein, partial [Clostridiales bacterium]|nr:cellulose binding domain-containing protein [Clostridiales bacterium]
MKNQIGLKKFVSLFLAVVFMLSSIPINVYANPDYVLQNTLYQPTENSGGLFTEGNTIAPDMELQTETRIESESVFDYEPEPGLVEPEYTLTNDDVKLEYITLNDWGSGFKGQITITNLSSQSIENWSLEFDLEHEINSIVNAVISNCVNGRYYISSVDYNNIIYPNSNVLIEFTGAPGNIEKTPANFIFNFNGGSLFYEWNEQTEPEANSESYTENSVFVITTAEQLVDISEVTSKSAHFVLGNNIDLSAKTDFYGIGSAENKFSGIFDGNGYSITLNINSANENHIGLFRYTDGALIKNLKIKGSVKGTTYVGSLVGEAANATVIENCENNANISGSDNVGGFVGAINNSVINNCVNAGAISGKNSVGGITGYAGNNSLITYCTVEKTASVKNTSQYVGGITGGLSSGSVIDNCVVYCDITSSTASQTYSGGISGTIVGATIKNSVMNGNVSGRSSTGGIAGILMTAPGLVEGCVMYGNITVTSSSSSYIGGIVGECYTGKITVRDSYYNGGEIKGGNLTGILVGRSMESLTIENSGYRVTGTVNTPDAEVFLDETLIESSQTSYDGYNFSILIPVSKPQNGEIINNTPNSVKFVLDGITETRNLSNAAKTAYNLNVDPIIFEDFEDFTAKTPDDYAEVTQIHSPPYAFLQKEIKTISATVANDVNAILIDVTTAGTSTWKLYADRYCTQEIASKEMNLSVGENFAYIKVTSGNEKYTKIYDVKITREPKRAQVLTGFTAFFREHEVLFVWDAAYEASVQGYNLYRSTSRGSGYTKIAY